MSRAVSTAPPVPRPADPSSRRPTTHPSRLAMSHPSRPMTRPSRIPLAVTLLLLLLVALALPGSPARAELAGQVGGANPPGDHRVLTAGQAMSCASGPRTGGADATWCWGRDGAGVGGRTAASERRTPQSLGPVAAVGPALDVASGLTHTCVVRVAGTVACAGEGQTGALGYGSTADVPTFGTASVDIGATPARAIAVGGGGDRTGFTCALLVDATVRCWGAGRDGRTGHGGVANVGDDEPAAAAPLVDLGPERTATAIAAGTSHACAILDTGDVRCWGSNADHQLGRSGSSVGNDETPGSVPPVDLGAGRTATAITAGDAFTCAILDTGDVRCWGSNADGRLGLGDGRVGTGTAATTIGDDETPGSAPPVALGPGRRATAIDAGSKHTCAVLDTGDVRCWGRGAGGLLGTGSVASVGDDETPASTRTVALGGTRARAVSASGTHTCADLGTDVACWGGRNLRGELGTGVRTTATSTPGRRRVAFGAKAAATTGPQVGRTADAAPVSGVVLVQTRRGGPFVPLAAGATVPVGSTLDTTRGRVRLTTAAGGGRTQSGEFYDGVFRVEQTRTSQLTVLRLVTPLACAPAARPRATPRAKGRKPRRRGLWGDGKGSFRTDGRYGTASVKGTRWYVEDRCDGTVVRVARGSIYVDDRVRRRSFVLRAGQQRFLPKSRARKPTSRVPG